MSVYRAGVFFFFLSQFNHDCQVFLMFCFAFLLGWIEDSFINIDPETFCCQNCCSAGVLNLRSKHSPRTVEIL